MVSINDLSIEFSSVPLFDHVSYVINPKDKIALVGKNGAGKTTMLKIIAGLQSPSSGSVNMPKDIRIGYLPQQMMLDDSRNVFDEVSSAFEDIKSEKERLEHLNEELSSRTDYESEDYHKLIEKVSNLTERLAVLEKENPEAEIEKTLLGLGFKRTDFNRMTSEFSGGWRMRIELAKILLKNPDVLLLDEPTNHLDIESIQWLENFIRTRANMVVLVSHDRAFMDNVTQRTIEIAKGKIYDYKVNYSNFVNLRKERVEQQLRAWQNQQKMIQDTEDFIERFRYKATKAVQVQSRIKQLSKIERIEIDEEDNTSIKLRFPAAPRSGDFPIIIENVGKSYGDIKVFDNVEFTLRRGDKVAFVGRNGEGKSTLVKCINHEIPFTGNLKIGHNVKIGYFAQNQAQLLDGEITVFDTIDRVAVGDIRTRIKDILGAFRFGGEESEKKVKVLSGGEKTRLAMIKLLLEPVNLLILDEPTNHLDIKTKDVLKQAIKEFEGTVIVVSHDREFLDGLVDKVYEFRDGRVREHLGGIYDFLRSRQLETLTDLERKEEIPQPALSKNTKETPVIEKGTPKDGPKRTYAEQREYEKARKRALKKVQEAEAEVTKWEEEIRKIEETMMNGDNSLEILESHAKATKNLENAMSYWELAVMESEI